MCKFDLENFTVWHFNFNWCRQLYNIFPNTNLYLCVVYQQQCVCRYNYEWQTLFVQIIYQPEADKNSWSLVLNIFQTCPSDPPAPAQPSQTIVSNGTVAVVDIEIDAEV